MLHIGVLMVQLYLNTSKQRKITTLDSILITSLIVLTNSVTVARKLSLLVV